MKNENLKSHIQKYIQLKHLYLNGNEKHMHIIAIGDIFHGMKNIKRQKLIYQPLTSYIIQKKIHAITIDTFTPKEWEKIKYKYI